MNKMTKPNGPRARLLSSFDSRFETLEMAGERDKSLRVQLGGKLRKIFTLPSHESTPDKVKRLLQELEGKYD